MIRCVRPPALTVFLAVVPLATPAYAYHADYPPLPPMARVTTLRASPIIDGAEGTFHTGPFTITVGRGESGDVVTRILRNTEVLFDSTFPYPETPFLSARVYYADLTGDGLKDFLIYSAPGGNGLGALIEFADVLIARTDGQFDQHSFETTAGGSEDFVDVNGDGRFELLWGAWYHAQDGHTYWVYRLIDPAAGWRLRDALLAGFPKILQFTHQPNAAPAAVSDAVRAALLQQSTARWQFGQAMAQLEPDVMSTSYCEVAQIDLDRDGSQESVLLYPVGAHGSQIKIVTWRDGQLHVLFEGWSNTPGTSFLNVGGVPAVLLENCDYEPDYVSGTRTQTLQAWNGTAFAHDPAYDCVLRNEQVEEGGRLYITSSDEHCLPKREPIPTTACSDLQASYAGLPKRESAQHFSK